VLEGVVIAYNGKHSGGFDKREEVALLAMSKEFARYTLYISIHMYIYTDISIHMYIYSKYTYVYMRDTQ